MTRRWLVVLAVFGLPLAIVWGNALLPAAAQSMRCAGAPLPWEPGADPTVPCAPLTGVTLFRVPLQVTNTPTSTPILSPTPYSTPTPLRTNTPTATPGGAGTPTATATATPTGTRSPSPTPAPGATNTPTFSPTPPQAATPTASPTSPPGATPSPTRPPITPPGQAATPSPTTTVRLPPTGDGSYQGEDGPPAGWLAGGVLAAFLVALVLRARRARTR
jgi:hypothetical protein